MWPLRKRESARVTSYLPILSLPPDFISSYSVLNLLRSDVLNTMQTSSSQSLLQPDFISSYPVLNLLRSDVLNTTQTSSSFVLNLNLLQHDFISSYPVINLPRSDILSKPQTMHCFLSSLFSEHYSFHLLLQITNQLENFILHQKIKNVSIWFMIY